MYEYKCKVNKVIDGDTVDVDIDLGFGVVLTDERVRAPSLYPCTPVAGPFFLHLW